MLRELNLHPAEVEDICFIGGLTDPGKTDLKDLILQADGSRVRRIILFGSRARGDARPDSDFDLLVVFRHMTPEEKRANLLALYRVFEGAGVVAEPWVMGEEEFEETKTVIGGLAYPAWKEGVLLYENP
ncbi:MAG: nucleotidyltransferase domain-containing protein [Candidatus Rokubacteria bacterium]|nr:nucleotidyltransferase domain-containing protein [Candidatus Rokubacteria bacterium]